MAFSKKTWKDRVSQYINRRLLTDSDGNTQQVTVTRDEGSVTEAGDAFSASNMNDLEDRIETAFDGLTAADIPYSAGVSVADKLDDLSTVDTYTLTSTCIVYRVGKLCTLACTGSSIPANTGSYATRHILGTLPAGYRPPLTVFGTPTRFPTLSSFMVTNAGEVSVRNSDTSNAIDCFATLTYIATD